LKGGERLGDKEGSEEEEEVTPRLAETPEVRPLTSGAFLAEPARYMRKRMIASAELRGGRGKYVSG